MNESIVSLESLPNELLIEVFKYFYAGELLQTFFNLNLRLNQLIKSMNYLSLIVTRENHDQIDILSSCLYTLTIKDSLNLNLGLFGNLRRLVLINPIDELFAQFEVYQFENLEHLSIQCVGQSYQMPYLYQRIFSNGFSNLQSYHSLGYEWVGRINGWTGAPMLRILKLGDMQAFIIRSILLACPNLYYLDCGIIIRNEFPSKIEPHFNLKHLVFRTPYNAWLDNQNQLSFKDLFACIPNLERLSIHRRDNISIINKSFIKYDWLSSILRSYFPLLQRFYCYLHVLQVGTTRIEIGPRLRNILNEIIENFHYVHHNRYRTRLIID